MVGELLIIWLLVSALIYNGGRYYYRIESGREDRWLASFALLWPAVAAYTILGGMLAILISARSRLNQTWRNEC